MEKRKTSQYYNLRSASVPAITTASTTTTTSTRHPKPKRPKTLKSQDSCWRCCTGEVKKYIEVLDVAQPTHSVKLKEKKLTRRSAKARTTLKKGEENKLKQKSCSCISQTKYPPVPKWLELKAEPTCSREIPSPKKPKLKFRRRRKVKL